MEKPQLVAKSMIMGGPTILFTLVTAENPRKHKARAHQRGIRPQSAKSLPSQQAPELIASYLILLFSSIPKRASPD